jgi:transcription initiation factor IIE alpha subunit
MNASIILQYMKKHGQKLDREISKDTGISLSQVRLTIAELQSAKEVSSCNVINFEDGVLLKVSYAVFLVISHLQHRVGRLLHKWQYRYK